MRVVLGRIGAKADYLIERWKRGVFLMLIPALWAAVCSISVYIPMWLIGAALGEPAWSAWQNVATVAAIFAMPFYLTSSASLSAFQDMAKDQREADKAERTRRQARRQPGW
ncbi:hypothetical protein VVT58_01950 [Sphingobium sp. SJ10-10]|uniref:hypothetical protein n=1 Tax=Sphingobium sp. SJ10-10 TaxID=3114999 RepID=UPI002E179DB7|nr:hypothetical protein [Sphingobium sp. SJ10-10]